MKYLTLNTPLNEIINLLNLSYPTLIILESNNIRKVSDLIKLKDECWIRFSKLKWRIHRKEMSEITKLFNEINLMMRQSMNKDYFSGDNINITNCKKIVNIEKWKEYKKNEEYFYKNSWDDSFYLNVEIDKKCNQPKKKWEWIWKYAINMYLKKIYSWFENFDIIKFFNIVVKSMDISVAYDILKNRLWFLWDFCIKDTLKNIWYNYNKTKERIRQQEQDIIERLNDAFCEFATKVLWKQYLETLLSQNCVQNFGKLSFSSYNNDLINWNWLAFIHDIMLKSMWYTYYLSKNDIICDKLLFIKGWVADKNVIDYMIKKIDEIHSNKKVFFYNRIDFIKYIMDKWLPLYVDNPVYEFILNEILFNVYNTTENNWVYKITTNGSDPSITKIVKKYIKSVWPRTFRNIINYVLKNNKISVEYIITELSKNIDNTFKFDGKKVCLNSSTKFYQLPNIYEINHLCKYPEEKYLWDFVVIKNIHDGLVSYWFDKREIKIFDEILWGNDQIYSIILSLWPINSFEKVSESIWKLLDLDLIKKSIDRNWDINFILNLKWLQFFSNKYEYVKTGLKEIEEINSLSSDWFLDEISQKKIDKIRRVFWIDSWWYFYCIKDSGIIRILNEVHDINVNNAKKFILEQNKLTKKSNKKSWKMYDNGNYSWQSRYYSPPSLSNYNPKYYKKNRS